MSDPERKRWIVALLVTALVAVSGWGWGSLSLRVGNIERDGRDIHGRVRALEVQYADIKELLLDNNRLLRNHMGFEK